MKLRILGTRGEIPVSAPTYERHSGMLVDDELLIDFGEASYAAYKPKAIVITHLHPDHAIFMRGPIAVPDTPIYAPERKGLPFVTVLPPVLHLGDYAITAIPIRHSGKVRSRALLIEKEGKRMLYTGDMLSIDKKYLSQLGSLDCVVTEASTIRAGGIVRSNASGMSYGHAGVPDLITLFAPHTKRIVLTHFGSWFVKDVRAGKLALAKLKKNLGVDVIVAHDGFELIV
jgi:ribonuclease BN (tRNA processing enzyme)